MNHHENKYPNLQMLKILWVFIKPFYTWMIIAITIMLFATVVDLLRPYLLMVAIDKYIINADIEGVLTISEIYIISIVVSAGLSYGQIVILQHIGQKIIYVIRQQIFARILYLRYVDIETQSVGRLITNVTNDTDAIKDLYSDVLVSFISDGFILIGIIFVMFYVNYELAVVACCIVPIMFLVTAIYQKYARNAFRLVRERTAIVNTCLQETLQGIAVIKAFFRFERCEAEFRTISDEYMKAGLMEMKTFSAFRPLVDLICMIAVVSVLWYGNFQNYYQSVEIGVVIAFLRYIEKFFWPIRDLAEKYNILQAALAAAERIYSLLTNELPSEQSQESNDALIKGEVAFENIWFSYDQTNWSLKNVSFTIKPGQFVGLVGISGSGKTTILQLLLRFYKPQRGRILLDGVDIQSIPYNLLRKKIGVVFQDIHLFKGTVHDNIAMYKNFDKDEVIAAAQIVNLHHYIMGLPQKYEDQIGYQGAWLSDGQKQLLSLARVLVNHPPIIVLDEATSNIDSETERYIQQAIEDNSHRNTAIVIAHRLSTIRNASYIIVLHQGEVVERGNHDELFVQKGYYYRLCMANKDSTLYS